jgi:hypothetical protein
LILGIEISARQPLNESRPADNYPSSAHNQRKRPPSILCAAQAANGETDMTTYLHILTAVHASAQPLSPILEKALLAALSKPQTPPQPPNPSGPSAANPAVARCIQAYADALQQALKQEQSHSQSRETARTAYREAMPPLSGHENIRDFIACTAHAILINAIDGADGARLLYAAQVAAGHLRAPQDSGHTSAGADGFLWF